MAAHLGSFVDDVEGVVGPSVWTGGASTPPSWVVLDDSSSSVSVQRPSTVTAEARGGDGPTSMHPLRP